MAIEPSLIKPSMTWFILKGFAMDIEDAVKWIKALTTLAVFLLSALGWSIKDGFDKDKEVTYTKEQMAVIIQIMDEYWKEKNEPTN